MPISYYTWRAVALVAFALSLATSSFAEQSVGSSGALNGTVLDVTGAVVPGATVTIHNPVSGLDRNTQTDTTGQFNFTNIPFNPYHLAVAAKGFAAYAQDVELRSVVPVTISITLTAVIESQTVTVHGEPGDLVETDTSFHSDVDRNQLDRLPESQSISSAVTSATPGVSADSNNMMHGLGDHAENTIAVDGQVNSDQTSKTFSNQMPADSIQSMEVIAGAPPAEFGGKTSLVVKVNTRSGQGSTKPTGSLTASYGSFGTANTAFDVAYGGQNWGNFLAISGSNTGRFLDAPEFAVMHDKGNQENFFDRVDYQIATGNSIHVDLGWDRSWFQTPQTYDNLNLGATDPSGNPVPAMDQRTQIKSYNFAPTWTRLLSQTTVFTLAGWVRHDDYHYYPSGDPFADLGPLNLQRETIGQHRTLANTGIRSDLSYVHGIHNLKIGVTYQQTFLRENDNVGVVDPTLNAPCVDATGVPVRAQGITDPANCSSSGFFQNLPVAGSPATGSSPYPFFDPTLLPYDLTRGGGLFAFKGQTDVKELGTYIQDTITKGDWSLNLGLRGDVYNGLSKAWQAEPRLGMSYNLKKTNSVLRISYARTLETPFNENLVLSNNGCNFAVIAALVPCVPAALNPGFRNEFHAGIEQAISRYLVFNGEYIWKYTHNAYDFSVLGNTPITFPIEWHNSKIPGFAASVRVPEVHGFSATVVFSSVAARFFPPQAGGLGVTVGQNGLPFRIDHDEKFNQQTHFQYQPLKRGPWLGFSWRYDSGQVVASAPCYGTNPANNCPASTTLAGQPAIAMVANGAPLTADEEFEAGFYCGSVHATPTTALPSVCPVSQFGSTLIQLPAPGTQNDDHNPQRIAARNLFDAAVGVDNIFHGDKRKWDVRVTALNLTNKVALYNFLSTFSGTHYVTPRALTAELQFHF